VKIIQEAMGPSSDQIYRIAPEGRLDAVTVPSLEKVLDEQLEAGHVRIVFDLGGVSYLSSSGLRALLRARKIAQSSGGDVVLSGMNSRVQEIFEMIGFNSLFRVFETAAEAAAALASIHSPD
jgi:anti-anti-sigma factor